MASINNLIIILYVKVGTHAISVGLMPTGEVVTGDSSGEINFWKMDGSKKLINVNWCI
jgi:hypothetical protein